MKAISLATQSGVDSIKYCEVPTPELRPGEALIRVKAAALNRLDVGVINGKWKVPLPHIGGSDVVGLIEELRGPSNLKVGQSVVVNPSIPCSVCDKCKEGLACETVKIFGYNTPGGFAEFVTVPIAQLYPKPENLSYVEAAAFPLTFLTAFHMLVTRALVRPGEIVFIWGASGGLGSAAVQIAHHLGAKVIAAASDERKADKIQALGADHVVIYSEGNVVEQVKNLNHDKLVDVVFESVGAGTWPTTLSLLRPGGRVVIAGTTSGDAVSLDLSDLYRNQISVIGARMGTAKEFEEVLKLVADTGLKPVIDKVHPLKDFVAAEQWLDKGKQMGKIVLEISPD